MCCGRILRIQNVVALAVLATSSRSMIVLAAPPAHPMPGVTCSGDPPIEFRNPSHQCVPPDVQRWINAQSAANARRLGLVATTDDGGVAGSPPTPLFQFFPIAGNTDHGDTFIGQFVDLNPAASATQDYLCRTFVADGHAGHDCGILTFTHQSIGVPVFAAKDGTVTFAQDGFADMNLFGSGQQGNIIAINHGSGIETQYYHLKNGSVAVTVGQVVKAGQQIGMTASSGNSFGPHLHFGTVINGVVYEPCAGTCRAGSSGWSNQAVIDTNDLFLDDFGITKTNLNNLANPWWQPWEIPCDSQFSTSDPSLFFYFDTFNFPANCPFGAKIYRPDNSLAADYTSPWGNADFYRHQKAWVGFDIPAMGPTPGTWRLDFRLNGQLMISAPFEMVAGPADPNFNRPPEPITVAFDPPVPSNSDVVFCRVNTTLGREDLDWDIVRYRFVWKVNGVTVRDVTNASLADAIPHHLACGGSSLTCTVTPNDGTVNGSIVQASVVVSGPHGPDVNCDQHVNVADLLAVITGWGACGVPLPNCVADVNGDGQVNVADLLAVITNWG